MAMLMNVEVYWVKCDPEKPSKLFSPKNPTWELQMRTTSKDVRKEWTNLNIKSKAVREDKDDEDSKILYYVTNLKKRSLKDDGTKAPPVTVVNGRGKDLDPNTIGNGSIANIRIFQHNYSFKDDDGKVMEGVGTILMGIQVVKHVMYVAAPMEDFDDIGETEVIMPDAAPAGSAQAASEDDEY